MSDSATIILAFGLALVASLCLTPLARRLAVRTNFLDHPVGYKGHQRATPYLGGLAVVAATLLGWTVVGGAWGHYLALTLCVVTLLAVGTLDDRFGLGISIRFAAQIAAAGALWATGLGWAIFESGPADLLITIAWVVGIVNAFNLMDNMDGAATTVAASSAAGIAVLAFIHGDAVLGGLAMTLGAACLGFLPFNLAKPARIFLGDGGSTPIGLAVAGLIMVNPANSAQWTDLLAAVPLVGLPILDTAMVVFSRSRRGVNVLSGARDHTTHRLLVALGTHRRVALALGAVQLVLCALSIALYGLSMGEIAVISVCYAALGCAAVGALDGLGWIPGRRRTPSRAAEELSA